MPKNCFKIINLPKISDLYEIGNFSVLQVKATNEHCSLFLHSNGNGRLLSVQIMSNGAPGADLFLLFYVQEWVVKLG